MTTQEFSNKLISMKDNFERFALFLTYNKEDSKDLLQETYLKALNYKDKYIEVNNFKAWTFAIMRNTFINNYRRSVRENAIFLNTENLSLLSNVTESQFVKPDSDLALKEIGGGIDALDDELKIPLKMYIEGYKYKEIAINLNLKIGTVKSRIFFARRRLMEALQDYQ